MDTTPLKGPSLSQQMAEVFSGWSADRLPEAAKHVAVMDLIDMAGLCVAARGQDYVRQIADGWDSEGACAAIGQSHRLDAAGAACVMGIATHGEDFDDTLEGAPIRVGAMVIPAVLAAGQRFGLSGERVLTGIVAGLEAVCRINHVAAGHMHRACFHPVGVIGALGSAFGTGTALGLTPDQLAMAVGTAGSFSSGIIEFLTDGAWTKRLHPGWAAQSGLRAALIARQGFFAPRTVFEGVHNFFRAFAPTATPDYSHLTEGLGETFYMQRIAFKPYACGTMIHPYIDCMIRLGRMGIDADQIDTISCPTGEGLVHRLWEPLADKQDPPSGYAAKFSMPFCMAVGFFDGDAGLGQFSDARARDPQVLALARKISYVIDPDNEYPRNYSGHIRVTMKDGSRHALDQPHMRGGVREPLTDAEIRAKFRANVAYGGWPEPLGERLLQFCEALPGLADLSALREFGQ
ncbi:MAG: MmgE/PrpD family protein [Rhodobacteraceae bacterium]|nr:MmgE/PrpD family protein [Paracoccaceae bacterium]